MLGKKLSYSAKFSYGVGGSIYICSTTIIGLFITQFLLEQAQLRPSQISIIILFGKCWDAIIDPIVGYLVNRTNTRWGKFRPWIIFPTPIIMISYMMLWYVPNVNFTLKTIWYLIFYCIFQLSSTCQRVPYVSLTMYLTKESKERDMATQYRVIFEAIGLLLSSLIQGVMITIYGNKIPCDTNSTALFNVSIFNNLTTPMTAIHKAGYNKISEGYLVSAAIVSVLFLIVSCVTFFGTKEVKGFSFTETNERKNFLVATKLILSYRPFLTLLCAFLFFCLAGKILETNITLYLRYAVDAKHVYQYILFVVLISCIISMPLLKSLMFKIGKKSTYASGILVFIPALFTLLFVRKPEWYVYIISCAFGYSIASNFLLPWSLLPDVIDEFMINTGDRYESIFYSFFVFFVKIVDGFSVVATNAVLEFVGFINCINGCCIQPDSVGKTLRYLISLCPIVILLISLFFIWNHPIDEKRRQDNYRVLNEQRLLDDSPEE